MLLGEDVGRSRHASPRIGLLAWLAGRRVGRTAAERFGLGPAVADRTALAALLLAYLTLTQLMKTWLIKRFGLS